MAESLRQAILLSALVGTERQPFTPPSAEGPLGELLAGIDPADRERSLLASSAALTVYSLAGRLPISFTDSTISPCELDHMPPCGPSSSMHLDEMLNGPYESILEEWLEVAAMVGRRVREDKLPALLDAGARKRKLRPVIQPVIGERGRWLASQNPAWNYVASRIDEESWETGNSAERLAVIKEIRQSTPEKAREMIISTWSQESPEDRTAFVQVFEENISKADEEFLESALDDKRKEVRRAAMEAYAKLPDSSLCGRMIERLCPLLKFESGQKPRLLLPGRKAKLAVTLPTVCDKEMLRDGVEPKPPQGTKIGEKAWWLSQMIGFVPPSFWCREWNAEPAEIFGAANGTEWNDALLRGWIKATERFKDADWAENIVGAIRNDEKLATMGGMISVIPPDRLEAITGKELVSGRGRALLSQCTHRFSPEFSRQVLQVVKQVLNEAKQWYEWTYRDTFKAYACCVAPEVLAEAESLLAPFAEPGKPTASSAQLFLSVLQFRHDMIQALQNGD